MVKRYYEKDLVCTELVKIYNCPDCGFEFNAMHEVDEQVGGWECPLCEVDELQKEIERIRADGERAYDILASVRDTLLHLVSPIGNACGDMTSCTVSNPECIKCLAEQIKDQFED
jgi:DNA-directed RNA polymerase subunit RPC12/RpoP